MTRPVIDLARHVVNVWEAKHPVDARLKTMLADCDTMTATELEEAIALVRDLARHAGSTGAACAAEATADALAHLVDPNAGHDEHAAQMARWAAAWGASGDDPIHVDPEHSWDRAWEAEKHWQNPMGTSVSDTTDTVK